MTMGSMRRHLLLAATLVLLGTGLWDNPRVYANASLQGGLYAAPDSAGFRSFSSRYRAKFGVDPVRTATLAYDAIGGGHLAIGPERPARGDRQRCSRSSDVDLFAGGIAHPPRMWI